MKNKKEYQKLNIQIIDYNSTYIEDSVKLDENIIIYPNTILCGNTTIKENCKIGPNTHINNSLIEENTIVESSKIESAYIKENCKIGPFSNIRKDTIINENVKIGNFVEIKKSTIGKNTKILHHTYIGDSEIGENVNFGCGCITANFNGKTKEKTIIGNNCFIGCNTNIIAPIKIGNNVYIGAGATVTKDLNDNIKYIPSREYTIKELK